MTEYKFYQNLVRREHPGYNEPNLYVEQKIAKLKNKYKHHKINIGEKTIQRLKRYQAMKLSFRIVENSIYGTYSPYQNFFDNPQTK